MSVQVFTFGICAETGKVSFGSRADAKYVIRLRKFTNTSAFLCDCGYFHIGGKHGILERSAHRALHGRASDDPDGVPIDTAAAELGVTPELIHRIIAAGKARGTETHIDPECLNRLRESILRRD